MNTLAVCTTFILLFLPEDLLAELGKLFASNSVNNNVTLSMFHFFFSMSRDCKEGTSGGHGVKKSGLGAGV